MEERLRNAEVAGGQTRQALSQAEHAARAHEAAAEKLRERLKAKVRAEERIRQRDAEAHSRVKRALASHRGKPAFWYVLLTWSMQSTAFLKERSILHCQRYVGMSV